MCSCNQSFFPLIMWGEIRRKAQTFIIIHLPCARTCRGVNSLPSFPAWSFNHATHIDSPITISKDFPVHITNKLGFPDGSCM